MKPLEYPQQEETLDPQNWDEARALGHQMVDDMMDYLQQVRNRPVWKPVPAEIKARLAQPLPRGPQPLEEVYQDFTDTVLPYPMGNIHPRFWGWVMGNGSVTGMLAEMLASTMNPNMGGGEHVANYVEAQVIAWCKEMLGFPSEGSGLLVSGASMANLVGLAVARNSMAEIPLRKEGLSAVPRRMVLYASREVHSCVKKAAELLGLGSAGLRLIAVDREYRMLIPELEATIRADRKAGLLPFCVVGTAGTVNTGAFDDLDEIAAICRREKLWFHVDGAFGSLAAISERLRPLTAGMEKADSLALDLHKWMYMPFEIACVLVRDPYQHRSTFAENPDYLAHAERGLASGTIWYSELGVQLTRGFRALKAWMLLKEHGIDKYARLVEQNVAQAQYLAELVDQAPGLERLAPVSLNIVCFRYNPGGLVENTLNALNQELLIRLHESGIAAPSYTTLDGQYVIRAAITNYRSRKEDFRMLVDAILKLGSELAAMAPAGS